MAEQIETDDTGLKPGELGPVSMLFLKLIFSVGISLPILLCGYGLLSFFLNKQ